MRRVADILQRAILVGRTFRLRYFKFEPKIRMSNPKQRSVCPLDCPSACSLLLTLDNGRLKEVHGNSDHPFTQGVICGKIRHYPWKSAPENRILYPLKRVGRKGEGRFVRIPWEEAVGTVVEKIRTAVSESGGESLLQYYYGGTMGHIQRKSGDLLFDALGSTRLGLTICSESGKEGWLMGVGPRAKPPEEVTQSRLVLLWGINAAVTHINFMTLVKEARRNGAKVVVVDPYRNETAKVADRHLQIHPGTDAALAMGIAHLIFRNGWEDAEFLHRYAEGVEEFRREAEKFPAERVSNITGLSPEVVREIARDFSERSPVFIRLGLGSTRQLNGWNTARLVSLLPALTGDWNREGGGGLLFTSAFFKLQNGVFSVKDRPKTRTLNMIRLGEGLLEWKDPPIRVLYVHSSNPGAVAPNQRRVVEGLLREDLFTVVHEQNHTETTRFADVVLPATFMFEHEDLYTSYGQTTYQYGPKLCDPPGEAKSNLEVFSLLEEALGLFPRRLNRTVDDFMADLLRNPAPTDPFSVERLKREGWLQAPAEETLEKWKGGFPTKSGRARFVAPELKERGFPETATYIPAEMDPNHPFRLITPPSVHMLNSTFSSIPRLVEKGGGGPQVMIHPEDAAELGLTGGDRVRLFNDRGELEVTSRVTEDVPRGVLVCESIWKNGPNGGFGINVLTSDEPIPIGGTAAFHGAGVSLVKVAVSFSDMEKSSGQPEFYKSDGGILPRKKPSDKVAF